MTKFNHQDPDSPEHVLMVFVDGLGIGSNDTQINPCTDPGLMYFRHFQGEVFPKRMGDNRFALGLDANLDVAGLPQSATGQTALLTGINAAQILGRHLNAFPNRQLRDIIAEHGILKRLVAMGFRAAFLNTFRPPFFDHNPYDIIRFLSVTSLTNLYANLPFLSFEDIWHGRSVFHDITNESLRLKGFDAPLYSPEQAGVIIGKQVRQYDFCMFEFFQTDRAGHSQNMEKAIAELKKLDRFFKTVIETVDLEKTLVILTSDHGNIEDLSFRGHTRNQAMTLLIGKGASRLVQRVRSILDVTPGIIELFESQNHPSLQEL